MSNESSNRPSTKILKPDGGKTKSNAIKVPSVSLPKGGGAVKGIDEKFSVNAVNGTASFSIPLPFSPARGASPSLSLSYNSGSGNGIFGLGWNLGLSSVKRKTDDGLPKYFDAADSDTYLFSEAEDLVPEFIRDSSGSFLLDPQGDYILNENDSADNLFTIRYYRPRIEGSFARIERWTDKSNGAIKWRITTRENLTTLYGWTNNSVISGPQDATKIFEWLPEFAFDDKGNCCHYLYKKEDAAGFDVQQLHHKNRFKNGDITYTNRYLEKVLYGNKSPYKGFNHVYPEASDYLFSTVFDYGEYDIEGPYHKTKEWMYRPDAFSTYKSGFEIRTTRLCKRVMLFHHFTNPNEYDGLISSLNFNYDTDKEEDFTFLQSVTSMGYIRKNDGSYTHKSLPPMEFSYQAHEWSKTVKTIDAQDLVHAPAGLDELQYQFTDLYNEGLSGILTEQANGWYYKHNMGNGTFAPAKLVSPKPSFSGLGQQLQLNDLDADGGRQLLNLSQEPRGYFELNDDNEWSGLRSFRSMPNINLDDVNTRMLDLNGDGKPEIVISEENVFTWYPSEGRNGYSSAIRTPKPVDEEAGPHILFADQEQTIFLADMSGDGLTDIVRIKNGEVCYWPNLGYARFGAKIALDNSPVFDHPEAFNPLNIRLIDIDGSGTTDIIYLGKNKLTCWKNLSGNRFGKSPFEIEAFPEIHNLVRVTAADILGNGVACIVWSSPLSKDVQAPLRYIDLMNSKKPHVMTSYKNNFGKEVNLEYSPSTKFYLEDKTAGRPWATKLHFPVHCVSRTITEDKISGYQFATSYKYHHGYYDHAEREFRGFGMVEQMDAESYEHWKKGSATNIVEAALHQEPVVSKTWHHTGAYLGKDHILTQFKEDYWHKEMTRQGYSITHLESELDDARLISAPGIDPSILAHLSTQEWQEALRACKGMILRSETFAKDAIKYGNTPEARKKELTPFAVAANNCMIELLQPKGKNKHAIFIVKESESVSYSYERNAEDPRIEHKLNIQFDAYANILESAAVVYPRVNIDASLPSVTQEEQAKTIIIYTETQFTNDVISDDIYRLRLPSEVRTFELKGVSRTGSYYTPSDFTGILSDAKSDTAFYHELNNVPTPGKAQRRIIEHARSVFYRNNLQGALPLHQLESLAIAFESFQLAYTPELIEDIYGPMNVPGAKLTDALLIEGKFTHSEGDANWWIRSGNPLFLRPTETVTDAQTRFYSPIGYVDPYGSETKVSYYGNYYLFIEETEDAFGNKAKVDLFNFRTLSAQRMRDINNNLSEALTDELSMVKAIALMGKGNEADDLSGLTESTGSSENILVAEFFNVPDTAEGAADSVTLIGKAKLLLSHATTRFVYDIDAYKNTGKPIAVATVARREHFKKNSNAAVQLSFEYTSGLGEVILKKVQAEPGTAKKVSVNPDQTYAISDMDTGLLHPKQLRWIGNGRTIVNNKGNAVKEYEPYFSVTHRYEDQKELVETGVSPILYYDALGRLMSTDMPDGTFSKVQFDAWKQLIYDVSDTCLDSDWYKNRTNRLIDAELIAAGKDPEKEKAAADKSAKHAGTPLVLHFDTLSRPILSVEHNKNMVSDADEYYRTKILLDIEGNLRSVTDSRERPENSQKGNVVTRYKYDMLGNLVFQDSMDSGIRWLLINIMGNPLRTWDERNHEFQYFYDKIHRPLYNKVLGGDTVTPLDHVFHRIIYSEELLLPDRSNKAALQQKNLLGQSIKQYDTGGLAESPEYNFKGQPRITTRRLYRHYKTMVNWVDANLSADLEAEEYTFTTETDALDRIVKQVAPDGSIVIPSYNEAGLLDRETVTHLNPATTSTYIKDIDYNEKGQRNKIIYGNDVSTRYYYDKETLRLRRLETKRQNNDPLQDWHYTYDAAGNVTHIEDKNIPVTFFGNQKTSGTTEYTYDALYRLSVAKGRENNAPLNFTSTDNWNDAAFMHQLNPGDPMSVRNYIQRYRYDEVNNITQITHSASGNDWTRDYVYEKDSNRLKSTSIGAETYQYNQHAAHGFITGMPHLEQLVWNFKEELVQTAKQKINPGNGTAETTYYQYDGQGQRIRKITENQANGGNTPTVKEERIYIAGYELYKKHSGNHAGLERVSLSLMDEGYRFVMIETRNDIDDGTEKRMIRYQSHNYLGSATLELDAGAQVISYEEYHPFGTTAYQARSATIKATAKRYRYTGAERDEETGLEYHSARYYLPWLGRWLSADPIGIGDGVNVYQYVNNDPVNYVDLEGTQSMRVTEMTLQSMSPGQVQQVIVAGGGRPGPCYVNPTMEQRQADIAILRNILIRANMYDQNSLYLPPPDHEDQVVLMADSRGNGYIAPRHIARRQVDTANFGYQMEVLNNIRGGLGGAIGYAVGGERGSYVGAAVDGLATAAAGTMTARQNFSAISQAPPPPQRTVSVAPARPAAAPPAPARPVPVRPAAAAPAVARPSAPAAPTAPAGTGAPPTATPRDTRPYSAQRMRQQLEDRYGAGNVSSTTVPPPAHRSVRRASVDVGGGRSVGFDERGLPDFSPFSITTARVTRGSYRGEMRAATRQLREAINRGESFGVTFSATQLRAIRSGASTIPGYRWHHVSGGELQLIPERIHNAVPHIGSGAMRHGR